jgi:hypothetical protein
MLFTKFHLHFYFYITFVNLCLGESKKLIQAVWLLALVLEVSVRISEGSPIICNTFLLYHRTSVRIGYQLE